MENLLFKNVICKGYLKKQDTKYVYKSDIDDEYIEDENSITLNAGGSCEQDIYKFVEKNFEGICVGIFLKHTKREYIDYIDERDYRPEEQFILTKAIHPIKVAKVFYANNKSKLVPINKIEIWEPDF